MTQSDPGRESSKDMLARTSMIGTWLELMGVATEDIAEAARTKSIDQRLGQRLLEMGVITNEQLEEALGYQTDARALRFDNVLALAERVRERYASRARGPFDDLPDTQPS